MRISRLFPNFLKKIISFSRLKFIKYSKLVTDDDYKPQLSFSHDAQQVYSNHSAMQTQQSSENFSVWLNVLATDKIKTSKIWLAKILH